MRKKATDIAVNLTSDKHPDFKTKKQELKKLFEFATSGTHFPWKITILIKLMGLL